MCDADARAEERLRAEEERIKQMSEKSGHMLLFLSFALIVGATLRDKVFSIHLYSLREAMLMWSLALLPVVLGVLPLKELRPPSAYWYRQVKLIKAILLWIAGAPILIGWVFFVWAVREIFPAC